MSEIITDTQSHASTEATERISSRDKAVVPEERMFCCQGCEEDLPVSRALYPSAVNPRLCKECAAQRRITNKEQTQIQKQKQHQALEAIPEKAERGPAKRMTISLTRYTDAAVAVLSVGNSASEVVEEALVQYLAGQDAEVIAYVGRVFSLSK